jgi:hypothetical protein
VFFELMRDASRGSWNGARDQNRERFRCSPAGTNIGSVQRSRADTSISAWMAIFGYFTCNRKIHG